MLSMLWALCEKHGVQMNDQMTERLAQLLPDTDVQKVAADLNTDLPDA